MKRMEKLLASGEYSGLQGPLVFGAACCQLRPDYSVYRHVFVGLTPTDFLIAIQQPPDARDYLSYIIRNTKVDLDIEGMEFVLSLPLQATFFHVVNEISNTFAVVTNRNEISLFEICNTPKEDEGQWENLLRFIDVQKDSESFLSSTIAMDSTAIGSSSSVAEPATRRSWKNKSSSGKHLREGEEVYPDCEFYDASLRKGKPSFVRQLFKEGSNRSSKYDLIKMAAYRRKRLKYFQSVTIIPFHLKNLGRREFRIPIRQTLTSCYPKNRCKSYLDPRHSLSDSILHMPRLRRPVDKRSRHYTNLALYLETLDGDIDKALDLVLLTFPETRSIARKLSRYKQIMKHRREGLQYVSDTTLDLSDEMENSFTVSDVIQDVHNIKRTSALLRKLSADTSPSRIHLDYPPPVRFSLVNKPSYCFDTTQLYQYPPDQIAKEMTLVNSELFLKLSEEDLFLFLKQRHITMADSPNLYTLADHGGRVSRMVAMDILKIRDPARRVKMLIYYIQVANKCYVSRDFQSMNDVLCGLQCPPVYRLTRTWNTLAVSSPSTFRLFVILSEVRSPAKGYKQYAREIRQCLNLPRQPFLVWLGHVGWHLFCVARGGLNLKPESDIFAQNQRSSRHSRGQGQLSQSDERLVELVRKLSRVTSLQEAARERLLSSSTISCRSSDNQHRRSRISAARQRRERITDKVDIPADHDTDSRPAEREHRNRKESILSINGAQTNFSSGEMRLANRGFWSLGVSEPSCLNFSDRACAAEISMSYSNYADSEEILPKGINFNCNTKSEPRKMITSYWLTGEKKKISSFQHSRNKSTSESSGRKVDFHRAKELNNSSVSSDDNFSRQTFCDSQLCECCEDKMRKTVSFADARNSDLSMISSRSELGSGLAGWEERDSSGWFRQRPPSYRCSFRETLSRKLRMFRKAKLDSDHEPGSEDDAQTDKLMNWKEEEKIWHKSATLPERQFKDPAARSPGRSSKDSAGNAFDHHHRQQANWARGLASPSSNPTARRIKQNTNQSSRPSGDREARSCGLCGGMLCVYGENGPGARLLELQVAALRYPRFLSLPVLQRHLRLYDVPAVSEHELLEMSFLVEP